jgi:hypothetical protein
MKKIVLGLILLLILPNLVLADATVTAPEEITKCKMRHKLEGFSGITCPTSTTPLECEYKSATYTCATCCLLDTIFTITDWVFYLVLSVAIILVIWGAYQIMTAGGAPDKIKSGRDFILWSIVGLIVALLAKSIPSIARTIIGA